jgi:3-oxoadipate enol-lactonase
MNKTTHRLPGAGGGTLHVTEWSGNGPTCLLLHGFGEGSFVWDRFALLIAPFCRLFAADLRGHGYSDWDTARNYRITDYESDIFRIIDHLALPCPTLVGHSLGGKIAIRVAARRAEEIRGLIVVDYGPGVSELALSRIRADFERQLRVYSSPTDYAMLLRDQRPMMADSTIEQIASTALRKRASGGFELRCDPALANYPSGGSNNSEMWSTLGQIICPTLVLRGAASSVLRHDVAQRMENALPMGRFVTVPRAGHSVMLDNATDFGNIALNFLRSLWVMQ